MTSQTNSPATMKVSWTWEEWQASRDARRAVALKTGPRVCRRKAGSSDKRLRKCFDGKRGPDF